MEPYRGFARCILAIFQKYAICSILAIPLNIPINIVLLKTTFPLGKAPWGKLPRGTFFWFPRGTVAKQRTLGGRSPGEFFDTSSPGERVFFSPGERCFFQGNVAFSGDFPLGERAFPRGTVVPLGARSPGLLP